MKNNNAFNLLLTLKLKSSIRNGMFCFICVCFASCNNGSNITFVYVDPLDKITPEQALFYPYTPQAEVCRGEHATFQFVVRSTDFIQDLTAKVKAEFQQDSLTLNVNEGHIYNVGYVHEGRTPANPASDLLYSPSRFYPDPLMKKKSLNVEPNVNAVLWFSIPIPPNTAPGSYSFEITVKGNSHGRFRKSIPFSIEVHSTRMPEQTLVINNWHYPAYLHHLISNDTIQHAIHSAELKKLAIIMNDYKQNAILLSPVFLSTYSFGPDGNVDQISMANFEQTIDLFARHMNLKLVAGGHFAKRITGWNNPFKIAVPRMGKTGETIFEYLSFEDVRVTQFYDKFLDSLSASLNRTGWKERYVQHIADEPTNENSNNYAKIASYIRKKMPGVRIIEATQTRNTSPYIDVLVPQLDYLHRNQDFFWQQQKAGKEIWFYTCRLPQGEYANRHIRQPLLKTRLLHWINYKYHLTGYLHWGYNYWLSSIPELETTGIQITGSILPGGDCWIVYPEGESILPSIRLEAMRDGIGDYELLKLAEQKDSVTVNEIVNQVIYDFDHYESSITRFRQLRRQLLQLLDQDVVQQRNSDKSKIEKEKRTHE